MFKGIKSSTQSFATLGLMSLGLMSMASRPGFATIFTLYSDKGVPAGTSVLTWPTPPAGATFNGADTTLTTVPEGLQSFRTQGQSFAGWGVFYPSSLDLSAYNSGEMRFWLYTSTCDFKVEIEYTNHFKSTWQFTSTELPPSFYNQWVLVRVPLTSVQLTSIYSPAEFTANSAATFYVDDVRYVDTTAHPIFNATLHNVSDNSTATQITWDPSISPGTWVRANQYIQLDLDADNAQWGVQIYTNNTAGSASPPFSTAVAAGQPGSNPAGLIHSTDHAMAVPLAWDIKASTSTVIPPTGPPIVSPPVAADPKNTGDPNSFQWLFMKDRQTPAIAAQNTTAFADGQIDAAVKNNQGIHFGQNQADIGAENPPNYIYLESNFPLAASTYQTNTITVEYYYP